MSDKKISSTNEESKTYPSTSAKKPIIFALGVVGGISVVYILIVLVFAIISCVCCLFVVLISDTSSGTNYYDSDYSRDILDS